MKTKKYIISIVILALFFAVFEIHSVLASDSGVGDPLSPPLTDSLGVKSSSSSASKAAQSAAASATGSTGSSDLYIPPTGLPDSPSGIKPILENLLIWLLGIFGIVAIAAFIISGLQYMLSAGNDEIMKTAKKNMTYSILGVLVALSAVVIIRAINAALSGSSFF